MQTRDDDDEWWMMQLLAQSNDLLRLWNGLSFNVDPMMHAISKKNPFLIRCPWSDAIDAVRVFVRDDWTLTREKKNVDVTH